MHALTAAGFAALVAVLATPTAMAIEEPRFKVIEKDGSFELREYLPYVVAETRVEAGFEDAGSVAFRRLFRYISGNNIAQQKIAMTAPVTQARGEKISMTAPVSQVADGSAYLVAFTLPSTYTLANAPKPLDPTVQIRAVPAQLIACWRYSGRWTESNYRDHEVRLRERIRARGLVARGDAVLARYNPPFTPWFMRRNEVLIPVAAQSKRSTPNRVPTGASGVSPDMALRLPKCLGRTPESWLAMQYAVISGAHNSSGPEPRCQGPPHGGPWPGRNRSNAGSPLRPASRGSTNT